MPSEDPTRERELTPLARWSLRGLGALFGLALVAIVGWTLAHRDDPMEHRLLECASGHAAQCAWLRVGPGLDWHGRTSTGQTYLQFVLAGRGLEGVDDDQALRVADLVLEAGVDIDAAGRRTGMTALHEMVLFKDVDGVRFLLERGAKRDVVAPSGKFGGYTPLRLAEALRGTGRDMGPIITVLAE